MAAKLRVESLIRNWLAENLEFISPELKLINKEFFLKDVIGAEGYIDLLCKDNFGNFVIIEIKRSENTARQTLNEILKYKALIKYNYRARDSEIRIVIISTVWRELIRPFSELIHNTSLDVSGYQIALDKDNIPQTINAIEPLNPDFLSRKFAYWHGLYLFDTSSKRNNFYCEFRKYLSGNELDDLVLLKLKTEPLNGKIMFPFAALIAFQQLTVDELQEVIKKLKRKNYKYLDKAGDFEDLEEYRRYLEGRMIDSLDSLGHEHESEACYPFKIYTMLNAKNWIIEEVEKSGIFAEDPRYTIELLIDELAGQDGSNECIFYGVTESTQQERFQEIKRQCINALKPSPAWAKTIEVILENLSKESRKFRLTISIDNRLQLIHCIYYTIADRDLDYLPRYFIEIDYLDSNVTDLYYGSLLWNYNFPKSQWVKSMTNEELNERMRQMMLEPDNSRDAHDLELCYGTTKYTITDDASRFVNFLHVVDGKLVEQNYYVFPFVQYAVIHDESLRKLVENLGSVYVR